MDLFLCHISTASPDAGICEYYPDPVVHEKGDPYESQSLLHYEDPEECFKCSRKKRRATYAAYPDCPPTYAEIKRSRPKKRGCQRVFTLLAHLACYAQSRRRFQILTRYRYSKQKKPYSAISVHVERLTVESYDEDDFSGIPDLIEVVRLQVSGPTEAARAIRKKLKYGDVHRQLRALTILDGLLQNGGNRLQRTILADGPLLERLRIAAVDPVSDQEVQKKCKELFGQWMASSKEQPGLEGAKSLYNQLPKKSKPNTQQRREQSKVLRETEEDARQGNIFGDDDDEPQTSTSPPSRRGSTSPSVLRKPSNPVTLSTASTFGTNKKVKKDKKNKQKLPFNLNTERPKILNCIAASSVASTNLTNALKLVNRETHQVSADPEVLKRFETCKHLRRQILRYIQVIESDEFLGGLIHANEELIGALMAFEVLDKSVDDDSDSELEEAQHLSRQSAAAEKSAMRDLPQSPVKPPRPQAGLQIPAPPKVGGQWRARKQVESESESEEESDEDDPFGDRNQVNTPMHERTGFSFREV
jgi:LAS seventeen-binding protein 5